MWLIFFLIKNLKRHVFPICLLSDAWEGNANATVWHITHLKKISVSDLDSEKSASNSVCAMESSIFSPTFTLAIFKMGGEAEC